MSCTTNKKTMAVSNDLLKVLVPPPQIKPVGITPAVNVGGKIATQTQGRGDGIFSQIINGALIAYSTTKQATFGSVPNPGITAGFTEGTGQDKQTQTGQPVAAPWYEQPWAMLLGLVVLAKFFRFI